MLFRNISCKGIVYVNLNFSPWFNEQNGLDDMCFLKCATHQKNLNTDWHTASKTILVLSGITQGDVTNCLAASVEVNSSRAFVIKCKCVSNLCINIKPIS